MMRTISRSMRSGKFAAFAILFEARETADANLWYRSPILSEPAVRSDAENKGGKCNELAWRSLVQNA
jgi:hypothetical protein